MSPFMGGFSPPPTDGDVVAVGGTESGVDRAIGVEVNDEPFADHRDELVGQQVENILPEGLADG
jgi:hypothetical protein